MDELATLYLVILPLVMGAAAACLIGASLAQPAAAASSAPESHGARQACLSTLFFRLLSVPDADGRGRQRPIVSSQKVAARRLPLRQKCDLAVTSTVRP